MASSAQAATGRMNWNLDMAFVDWDGMPGFDTVKMSLRVESHAGGGN